MSSMCIVLIILYQRLISPYKGYVCAYGHKRKHLSCSEYAKKVLRRHGIRYLLPLMRRRFVRCNRAACHSEHSVIAGRSRFSLIAFLVTFFLRVQRRIVSMHKRMKHRVAHVTLYSNGGGACMDEIDSCCKPQPGTSRCDEG